MRWPRRREPGRLPSLGHDFDRGHRTYVEQVGPGGELWLRTEALQRAAELRAGAAACTRSRTSSTGSTSALRAQVLDVGCGPGWLSECSRAAATG